MRTYDKDIVAWANEQARLLRAGRFDLLDVEHIAEEIEDVGNSEQRELASLMAVLLTHLLKWRFQPERRGASWEKTIRAQRKEIACALDESPSLRVKLDEPRWLDMVWAKAVAQAVAETGMAELPDVCPGTIEDEVLREGWLPEWACAEEAAAPFGLPAETAETGNSPRFSSSGRRKQSGEARRVSPACPIPMPEDG